MFGALPQNLSHHPQFSPAPLLLYASAFSSPSLLGAFWPAAGAASVPEPALTTASVFQ